MPKAGDWGSGNIQDAGTHGAGVPGQTAVMDGMDSPLAMALTDRDAGALQMVRRALQDRHVLLAFQPVVMARDTGRAAFHEALIRILDTTGRVIPARDFIGAVETVETGRQIDTLALEMGLVALSREPTLRLSVNMSARSIGYPAWKTVLTRALDADPTLAERLILEITESSAMVMPDLVSVFMKEMQQLGISFALDDFGAGYTALRHFKQFYFDILKIDGQFVRGVHADADNQVLVSAMISIGRHFDMFTVAECVEDPRDADFLLRAGVDCLQGYLYGAPSTQPPIAARMDRRARRA